MRRIIIFLVLISVSSCYHYSGYVKDYQTKEALREVYLGYSDSSFYTITDSSGFYDVKSMRKIRVLVVRCENYRTRNFYFYNFRHRHGQWRGGNIYLIKAGYSGYVLDSIGKPLSKVDVYAMTNTDSLHQLTDENGYFDFEDCNEFVFSIVFKKTGYTSADIPCYFLPPRHFLFKGDTVYLKQASD